MAESDFRTDRSAENSIRYHLNTCDKRLKFARANPHFATQRDRQRRGKLQALWHATAFGNPGRHLSNMPDEDTLFPPIR